MAKFFRWFHCDGDTELNELRKEFEKFKDAEKYIEDIPEQCGIEYLVYQLCDGDITKKEYIMDNITYADAMKWLLLRRYDSYAQREYMKN